MVPLFWNIRDKVILKVLLRVLARQNPNFLSCAVPVQRSTNIILYSLFFFNLGQCRIILSADTASEVRQMPSQNTGCCKGERRQWRKQRTEAGAVVAECEGLLPPKHDAGTATRHYRAFWQCRCRAAAAGAVLKPLGGNCAVLPYILQITPLPTPPPIWLRWRRWQVGAYSLSLSFAAY